MQTIRLTLNTVTALFLHGAETRGPAELRPPSIKGAMRFWFRALAGGMADLDTVRKAEAQVFGSTAAGQGVTVRVEGMIEQANPKPFLLPHKPDYGNDPSQKDRLRSPSPALKEGEEFTVVLIDRPGRDRRCLEAAAWSFWLAVNLGGFGQRARRGAGSLLLTKVEPAINGMQIGTDFPDANALKHHLEESLKTAKASFQNLIDTPRNYVLSSPEFPILTPGSARIVLGKISTSNEQEARKKIMELREQADPSHTNRAFGGINQRLASPVHIHIQPDGANGMWVVATWFKEPAQGNGSLVGKFLSELRASRGAEVTLP